MTTAHDTKLTTVGRQLTSDRLGWTDVAVNDVAAVVDLPEGSVGRGLLWTVLYDPAGTRRTPTSVDAARLAGKSAVGLWIAAGVAGLVLWAVVRMWPRR